MQLGSDQLLDQARQAIGDGGLAPMPVAGALNTPLPDWIPPAAVLVALAAVVVGGVVWLFGGKLLKPAFILIGGVIGSAIGAVYTPSLIQTIGGLPAAYPGMAVGLIIGMILSVVLFRFAMATMTAGIIGAAGILTAVIALAYVPGALPATDSVEASADRTTISADGTDATLRQQVEDQVKDWSGRLQDAARQYRDAQLLAGAGKTSEDHATDAKAALGIGPEGDQNAADAERIEAAKRTAQAISHHVAGRWQALPERSRLIVAASWMAGAMVGFLLGLLLPKKAAATVSALAGAAMLLFGAVSLIDRYTVFGEKLAGISALGWLGAWMVLAALGLLFQSRKSSSPAPAPRAAPAPA
jgi:F0F1-type ATP synthase assembly protein I